jgi:hypothetical protein
MARYRIDENQEGVAIQVTEESGHQQKLGALLPFAA